MRGRCRRGYLRRRDAAPPARGPLIDGSTLDVIALNGADDVLHLVSGLLLAGVALPAADKRARTHV